MLRTSVCLLALTVSHAWVVGFGTRSIDPSAAEIATNRIFLGGYGALGFRGGNLGFARGINDPLEATAYYLESGPNKFAQVVLDAIGCGSVLADGIRKGASIVTGVPEHSVLVTSTHSHCGPDLQGLWGGVTETYRRFVIERAIAAITEAYNSRREARVYVSATTPGGDFNRNRRGWGWAINTTTVLQAFATQDNSLLGTVINFAAHPVTLGASVLHLSGDYCGFLRTHHRGQTGAPVVFIPGPIGDVQPGSSGGQGFERARLFGQRISQLAIDTVRAGRTEVSEGIRYASDNYGMLVTNPIFLAAWLAGLMDGYYEMAELPGGIGLMSYVSYLQLGSQIEGVTWPGESLTRHSQTIQNAFRTRFQFIMGLTQDSLGYLVPTDEWMTGRNNNYEENISTDRLTGDNARDRVLTLMQRYQGKNFTDAEQLTEADRQRISRERLAKLHSLNQSEAFALLKKATTGELKVEEMWG